MVTLCFYTPLTAYNPRKDWWLHYALILRWQPTIHEKTDGYTMLWYSADSLLFSVKANGHTMLWYSADSLLFSAKSDGHTILWYNTDTELSTENDVLTLQDTELSTEKQKVTFYFDTSMISL